MTIVATNRLRLVRRNNDRVLQQLWRGYNDGGQPFEEWRDVPEVEETDV